MNGESKKTFPNPSTRFSKDYQPSPEAKSRGVKKAWEYRRARKQFFDQLSIIEMPGGEPVDFWREVKKKLQNAIFAKDSKLEDHIMGIVSEVGEAYEAHRNGRFFSNNFTGEMLDAIINNEFREGAIISWYPKNLSGTFEDEIADTFIRLFNLITHYKIDIENEWFLYGLHEIDPPEYKNATLDLLDLKAESSY